MWPYNLDEERLGKEQVGGRNIIWLDIQVEATNTLFSLQHETREMVGKEVYI